MKYSQVVSMPSAVSNWLGEQLEARGIDSEVYTRYILSLLHAHTLDFIFPEDDFSSSGLKKNAKRSAVSQKRLRRTQNNSSWWRRHAEAEQIKRSAAVECLMSAADQSCEIESLVDELCEKLKEINSESDHIVVESELESINLKESCQNRNISSKELAEKYYAAFPPLNHKEDNTIYFSSNINLVPGKWSCPIKNQIDSIAAKWNTPSGSPKKSKKKTKRHCNENMKSTSRAHKLGHKRSYSGRDPVTEMSDNVVNWQLFYNNNYQSQDQYLKRNNSLSGDIDMILCDVNGNDSPVCRMEVWLQSAEAEKNHDFEKKSNNNQKKPEEKFIALYPTSIWSDDGNFSNVEWITDSFVSVDNGASEDIDEEVSAIRKEYQRRRSESIAQKEDGKEEAEEEECAIKEEYYRRKNSNDHQWNPVYNEPMLNIDSTTTATVSSHQIGCYVENVGLSSDCIQKTYSKDRELERNETSTEKTTSLLEKFSNLSDEISVSLIKVNHSMENSAFCEYVRPLVSNKIVHPIEKACLYACSNELEEKKMASPHMYFEPIKPAPILFKATDNANAFQDGSTFIIDSTVSEVKFKRSESGTLHLEGDLENRKYLEYHWRPSTEEYLNMPMTCALSRTPTDSFNIKYRVSTNDKSCQTVDGHRSPQSVDDPFIDSADKAYSYDELQSMIFNNATPTTSLLHQEDDPGLLEELFMFGGKAEWPYSMIWENGEVVWGDQPKSSNVFCKYCNGQHPWLNNNCEEWNERALKDIWAGTESCGSCPWMNRPPTQLVEVETSSRLREESREEGERLLSDLSSLQLTFSANLLNGIASPSQDEPIEKKRRHR